jgi:hypothetical protein
MGKNFFTEKGFQKRVATIKAARDEALKKVDELHVKIQQGNSKTGKMCFTVSLMPILDCVNCSGCRLQCYDLRNDLMYPVVINDRAANSAIHMTDPKRFWTEVDLQVKALFVTELRINVGGDLTDEDFLYVAELGKNNPKTMILFFTKNYSGINKFLADNSFPENVHPIMSCWEGMEMENPYNLPCSHVLYEDGKTTAPKYGSVYCGGNCTECAFKGEGCWNLKKGESVIFRAH